MTFVRIATLTVLIFFSNIALAHHGWRWTSETDVEVTGIIETATLGNPHGILIIDVEGEKMDRRDWPAMAQRTGRAKRQHVWYRG